MVFSEAPLSTLIKDTVLFLLYKAKSPTPLPVPRVAPAMKASDHQDSRLHNNCVIPSAVEGPCVFFNHSHTAGTLDSAAREKSRRAAPLEMTVPWSEAEQHETLAANLTKSISLGSTNVVEAAGVEPASENVTGQKTTCLFQFMPLALPKDVRDRRSERTRNGCR